MRYIYLGATMLLVSTILALVFFGWKLAVIVFLAVQGNTIVQYHNDKLNKKAYYHNYKYVEVDD